MRVVRWVLAGALVSTGLMGAAVTGPAAGLDQRLGFTADALPTWQTEGAVWALAESDGKVFAGGRFGRLLPPAGSSETAVARANFAVLDTATGAPLPCDLRFTSTVSSNPQIRALNVSPDGRTLFAGGSFNRVNGERRFNLAAIDIATCTLAPLDVQPNATVRVIRSVGSKIYFGGDFTYVSGQARRRVAAADFSGSGSLLPWSPRADRTVRALELDPNKGNVIIGGDFNYVGGYATHALVVVEPTLGRVVRRYPVGFLPSKTTVQDLVRDETSFYLAAEGTGTFDGRVGLNFSDYNERWRDACKGATQALAVHEGVLYSGHHAHDCSSMNAFADGRRQHLLAEETANPTSLLPWYPDTNDGVGTAPLGPRDMVVSTVSGKSYLWVGGEFTKVNGLVQRGLTRFGDGPDTGNPTIPVLSASSYEQGVIRVHWRAADDADDELLGYELFRNGQLIATASERSSWWQRPQLTFVDTDVVPGASYNYRVRASDGTNTSLLSAPLSVTAATADSPYPKRILADDAVQYWRFDDPGFAQDETSHNNNGRYSGDVAKPIASGAISGDPSDYARFSGTNGYAYGERRLQSPREFSVELWFRTNTGRGGKLIGFGDGGPEKSKTRYDRHVYMNNGGRLIFGVQAGSRVTVKSSKAYNNGRWHHVVATEGPYGIGLYVDGVRVAYKSVSVGSVRAYSGFWHVGGDNLRGWLDDPRSDYLSGHLDEAAVYPTNLSGAQIADHYRLGRG